jgi:hypothetical protein
MCLLVPSQIMGSIVKVCPGCITPAGWLFLFGGGVVVCREQDEEANRCKSI